MNSIIQKYIDFSIKNLYKYTKIIFQNKIKTNDVNLLLTTYKEIRYYNYFEYYNKKIDNIIDIKIREIILKINSLENKEKEELELYYNIIRNILSLDIHSEEVSYINIINSINDNYKKLYNEDFKETDTLIKLIKENIKLKNKYLKNHETDKFSVLYKRIRNSDLYNTSLIYNFEFPKIYSEYAINKVYTCDMIQEQKLLVLYNMVSLKILKEIIDYDFKTKYIIDYPFSILEKKEKNQRLLEIINSEACKDKVYIKINYELYLENKDYVDDLIKNGFHIIIYFVKKVNFTEISIKKLDIFDYILVSDKELYEYYLNLTDRLLFLKEL